MEKSGPAAMNLRYPGSELELFAGATNWKSYVAELLSPYLGETVLDVGAGIGGHVPFLCRREVREWVCLEPDERLVSQITHRIENGELPAACRVVTGTLEALVGCALFSTVLYLDVLEHIADDRAEMEKAASKVADGGCLIVLAPAHQFLFSSFDSAIGHYRRYSIATLRRLAPSECQLLFCRMLDSAGFFASLANRLLLRSANPTRAQVQVWDSALVPISRRLDRRLGYRFGKSILALWKKTSSIRTPRIDDG
jgi:hypothetical protein